MSASVLKFTYGITGVQYKSFRKIKRGVVYCAEMSIQKIACPKCSCKNHHFKGKKIRRLKMPPTAHKFSPWPVFLQSLPHEFLGTFQLQAHSLLAFWTHQHLPS